MPFELRASTAMHFAAHKGFENIVQLLIDHGSCVNFEHPAMFNPLGLAAREGNPFNDFDEVKIYIFTLKILNN